MAADEASEPLLWTAPATAHPARRRLLQSAARWSVAALKWLGLGLNILGGLAFLPYTPEDPSPGQARIPAQRSPQHLAMPAPGHPERLIPDVPPTAAERELWAQLAELGRAQPGERRRER